MAKKQVFAEPRGTRQLSNTRHREADATSPSLPPCPSLSGPRLDDASSVSVGLDIVPRNPGRNGGCAIRFNLHYNPFPLRTCERCPRTPPLRLSPSRAWVVEASGHPHLEGLSTTLTSPSSSLVSQGPYNPLVSPPNRNRSTTPCLWYIWDADSNAHRPAKFSLSSPFKPRGTSSYSPIPLYFRTCHLLPPTFLLLNPYSIFCKFFSRIPRAKLALSFAV